MPSARPPSVVRFGPYRYDPETRTLTRRGRQVALGGQPLTILEILLERPRQVVTRKDLEHRLWPRAGRIDTSRRLNSAVRALRAALDEEADRARFVETVRGRGYRLKVAVSNANRARLRLAAACLLALSTAMGLVARSPNRSPQPAAPGDLGPYLAAVAALDSAPGDPDVRHDLEAFIVAHPDYRPGALLAVRLDVESWRRRPGPDTAKAARAGLERFLRRHGESVEALTLLAEVELHGFWNWETARMHLDRAFEHSPGHADAHRLAAWLHLNRGDRLRSWDHARTILDQAPAEPAVRADLGWLLLRLERPDLALALCSSLDEVAARLNTLSCRHTAQWRLGDRSAARQTALELMRELQAGTEDLGRIADADPETGYVRFLQWRIWRFDDVSWFQRAQLLAGASRWQEAESALEQALRHREPHLVKLISTPELDPLSRSASYVLARRAVLGGG